MPDSNGLNPGDPGYNANTDPSATPAPAPLSTPTPPPGGAYPGAPPPSATLPPATTPIGTFHPVTTPYVPPAGSPALPASVTNPIQGATFTGTTQNADGTTSWTGSGTLNDFSTFLQNASGNVQDAINAFNAAFPSNTLGLDYYPGENIIGIQGQSYGYLTGPGTTAGQTTWNPGGPGDSGGGGSSSNEFTDLWGSTLENTVSAYLAQLNAAAASTQAADQTLAGQLMSRVPGLMAPAYTDADSEVARVQASDQLNTQLSATQANNATEAELRGFAPTSGIIQDADIATRNAGQQEQTAIDSNLLNQSIQQNYTNQNEASNLEELANSALTGGDAAAIAYEGQQIPAVEAPLDLEAAREAAANAASTSATDPLSTILGLVNSATTSTTATNAQNAAGLAAMLKLLFPSTTTTTTNT
jgi:hypothetical protein